jgi:hypothetical protein
MLAIEWKNGPILPQGFQDNVVGIVDHTLVTACGFCQGAVGWGNRYIFLGGGAQYNKVANPDGTIREKYGKASRFQDKGDYYNDVFVFDTQTRLLGTADKLPLNNNATMTVMHGDKVYMLGGEIFGHYPDLSDRNDQRSQRLTHSRGGNVA